jgi:hypothetical protein
MAPLTCPVCAAPVRQGDLICINCGANLARREPAQSQYPQDQQGGQYPPQDQNPYPPQQSYPQQDQQYPPQQDQQYPPQQQGGYPPQQQGYGAPPQDQQQGYGAPPQDQQQGYGAPPQDRQQGYGAPPQQGGYPPQQDQYGPPPQDRGRPGGQYPPQQDQYGPPQQEQYGPPPQRDQYGPPQDQQYSQPQQGYPPAQGGGYPPQQQQGYGGGYGPGGAPHVQPPPREPTMTGGESTAAFTPFCPHCGAEIPDIGNPVCVQCLRPLNEGGGPGSGPQQQANIIIQFSSGDLSVSPGQELVLGRDPVHSPVASTFSRFDNVSRRHATLGIDGAGQLWVRDERSTNGTFVNDRRLQPGEQTSLRDGDSIRLAADARGQVRVGR